MNRPRWNVAVLDEDARSRLALSQAIDGAGGVMASVAHSIEAAVGVLARTKPDVAILALAAGRADRAEVAEAVIAAASCPVILYMDQIDEVVLRRASAAGAMGFLLKPLRFTDLAPTLDLAVARFKDIHRLREQLADRKVIERAKGLLMARIGFSENQAFQLLRRTAMNRRLSLVDGLAARNAHAVPARNGKAANG
jgi:response regulator NasT